MPQAVPQAVLVGSVGLVLCCYAQLTTSEGCGTSICSIACIALDYDYRLYRSPETISGVLPGEVPEKTFYMRL